MRISLIVAFYKDLEALEIIINALRQQDYTNFEVIVAEDNNAPEVAEYLDSISDVDILHTTQADLGIRKARSQNNAILESTGDYLIFIDGDCIPHPSFISSHAALSKKGQVLSGRRVNLGPRISQLIRTKSLKPSTLANHYLLFSPILWADHATHIGQGIYLPPKSWVYANIISRRKKSNTNILGCNFSCFKQDIINIDGFDESYGETALPDDTDIQWRFEASGLKLKTCKTAANLFHLNHDRNHRAIPFSTELNRMLEKKHRGDYVATLGLSSHSSN